METINAYYNSPVGPLEIRSCGNDITAVLFASSEWKGIRLDESSVDFKLPSSAAIQNCCRQLDEYFEGSRFIFDLPIAQSGTGFQQGVWNALLDIPYGKTISYLELSKRLGNVKAIRAVGTANGNNNVAIIVPCHRVIGSNGTLVGYGGDLWRKKWLLEHEAKFAHGVQTLF
ncbi:MAG: methylated-DNA--[protein]-cysteine S-methyltransferase [Ferruginibacter sp.]